MTGLKLKNLNMAVAVAGLLAAATACSFFGGGEAATPDAEATATRTAPVPGKSAASIPYSPVQADGSETALTADGLAALLISAGVELERVEFDNSSVYKPLPRVYFTIGDAFSSLDITQYPSTQFAMAEAASMSFDMQEQQRGRITWTGDPPTARTHVFVIGDLLVKYNGDDPVALDVLASAGGKLVAGGDYGAMAHGMPRITAYLESRGHKITIPERPRNYLGIGLFDRRGDTFFVNGQPLHIFDLRPTRGSYDYLREVSADGYTLTDNRGEPVRVEWELPPRIYATDHVIAIYVGNDPDVMDSLRVLSGPPERGVMEDEPYPFDMEWLVKSLQDTGAEVLPELGYGKPVIDVIRHIGDMTLSVNGELVSVQLLPQRPTGIDLPREERQLSLLEQATLISPIASQPHRFQRGNIEALYIGENESVLAALRAVLGWSRTGAQPHILMGLADAHPTVLAPIELAEVYRSQESPPGYTAHIVSTSEVCDSFHSVETERNSTKITITVKNLTLDPEIARAYAEAADGAFGCILRAEVHNHYIFLGNDFEPGVQYNVTVNGEAAGTFTGS